ncbi:MAG: ABC transporter permease [Gammaproteobacteria bacterium]|jgi:putative ABC transport system permease protein|nr:peptide ABC transporter permease [Chromatiales bacterium]MDP7153796.1 ABC transporter permease [Gammaproteobacteria bacterium]MDP7296835.1 ABC transporter permease [Gammaproteobacteria bacterium]MDP7418695.1 ABC transporter permease [Gammaproteobacteria bacterium]MDP7660192.1 ABC transporter permease [Gammaproteobacteria bacterium]
MRFFDCNRIAFGAVIRYPLRTGMMLLATSIGVGAVLMLTALGESARGYVGQAFQTLGTNIVIVMPGRTETAGTAPGAMVGTTERDLTLDDARALLRSPAIRYIAPVIVGSATVSQGNLERETTILGSTTDFATIRQWTMAQGEFLPNVDLDRASPVCVIGNVIRTELFGDEPPIGKWLRIGTRRCRVTGVLADQGTSIMIDVNEVVIVPVGYTQMLFDVSGLFRIIAQATDRESMDRARLDIIRIIKTRHYGEEDITVITQDAVLQTFDGIFDTLTRALAGIAAISLIVAGVLIMNVMLVAVSQRTREVGLLKALGATHRQIVALFLTEAAFLAVLGGITGLGFSYLVIIGVRGLYPEYIFMPPAWAAVGAFTVALVCGIFFGIWPARKAAAIDPIMALAGRQA